MTPCESSDTQCHVGGETPHISYEEYEEWAHRHATCRVYFWASERPASPSQDIPNRYCAMVQRRE